MAGVNLEPADANAVLATAAINSSSGTVTLVAASTGMIIRCYKIFFTVAGASNITFNDGTTALSGAVDLTAAGSAFTLTMDGQPWFQTSKGNALTITNSGSVSVQGQVYYTQRNY